MLSTLRPSKPICDLRGTHGDPARVRMRVVETLDQYGLHWLATDWWIQTYDNRSPNGIRQAASSVVTFAEPAPLPPHRGGVL
jgi:hypothetical protein